jgi:hypothetical protein
MPDAVAICAEKDALGEFPFDGLPRAATKRVELRFLLGWVEVVKFVNVVRKNAPTIGALATEVFDSFFLAATESRRCVRVVALLAIG